MKIEAIFFDMGGTLDLYPTTEKCIINACAQMKQKLEAVGASQISKYSEEEFKNLILNGIKKYKKWRAADEVELASEKVFSDFILAGTGVVNTVINDIGEDLALLIETGFHERTPRPEAGEVLQAIKDRGIMMGIISNVLSRTQVGYSLKKYGLDGYFDTIVLSSVFGKRKPHPAIFHHAFKEAGVNPGNAIFVGNSPSRDITGARNAGVGKTVYIEYKDTPSDELGSAMANYNIKNLRELIPIIDKLN